MSTRRVWIVGAGKRVRETALPAFVSLGRDVEIAGILARSARDLGIGGVEYAIRPLETLRAEDFVDGDIVYVAVGKDAMPSVLTTLSGFDRSRLELLIDTPVLKIKHLRFAPLLEGWQRASVAEDVVHLPWIETMRAAAGDVRSVTFDRSAYAYHGLAQSKAVCGADRVVRARRVKSGEGTSRREIELSNGTRALVLDPRDYSRGRVIVEGSRGRVTDRVEPGEDAIALELVLENGRCVGFRARDFTARLADAEIALQSAESSGTTVIARMESMKRVAFRRLAAEVVAGRGGYPIASGLDDMAVDWCLERFGRWTAGGMCDVRRPFARTLWAGIGRFAG